MLVIFKEMCTLYHKMNILLITYPEITQLNVLDVEQCIMYILDNLHGIDFQ